jgi:hypothetical protein
MLFLTVCLTKNWNNKQQCATSAEVLRKEDARWYIRTWLYFTGEVKEVVQ